MLINENSSQISHFLGIDWGQSKIGLAMSDNETRMAFAYKVLKNDKDLLQKLLKIVKENNVEKIVIGKPTHLNKSNFSEKVEKFGELLNNKLKVEIVYLNEMFTTRMAQSNLIEQGIKDISKNDDAESARIILQEWLDKE